MCLDPIHDCVIRSGSSTNQTLRWQLQENRRRQRSLLHLTGLDNNCSVSIHISNAQPTVSVLSGRNSIILLKEKKKLTRCLSNMTHYIRSYGWVSDWSWMKWHKWKLDIILAVGKSRKVWPIEAWNEDIWWRSADPVPHHRDSSTCITKRNCAK